MEERLIIVPIFKNRNAKEGERSNYVCLNEVHHLVGYERELCLWVKETLANHEVRAKRKRGRASFNKRSTILYYVTLEDFDDKIAPMIKAYKHLEIDYQEELDEEDSE